MSRLSPIRGRVTGMTSGAYVRLEILSNRWYTIGRVPLAGDGTFDSKPVYFGGEGVQACHHAVRARLYDERGNPLSVAIVFNVKRDGSACAPGLERAIPSETSASHYSKGLLGREGTTSAASGSIARFTIATKSRIWLSLNTLGCLSISREREHSPLN